MTRCSVLFFCAALTCGAQDQFAVQRERMVREQIASRGIKNADVLKAMRAVPRHLFVPPGVRSQAYEDRPVPIGYGQTISQPYIVAYMSDVLEVRPDHRVLEIGTGSGYQAAILSTLAREVYSIEIVPQLAKSSAETLNKLGYKNVTVHGGDGYKGWPEKAPFDRILLTAAPPEVPSALIEQLKPDGILLAPVGKSPLDQEIVRVSKAADGKIVRRSLLPVRFVPMVKSPAPL